MMNWPNVVRLPLHAMNFNARQRRTVRRFRKKNPNGITFSAHMIDAIGSIRNFAVASFAVASKDAAVRVRDVSDTMRSVYQRPATFVSCVRHRGIPWESPRHDHGAECQTIELPDSERR